MYKRQVYVLDKALKLLHPFMPFITEELYQALPGSPPDRQIDFIRGPGGSAFDEGSCVAAFTGGFLPCYDGAPERRRNNITDAVDLAGSRKTYRFSYGYLVTTSPQSPVLPSAASSLRLDYRLRVPPALMV